MDQTILLLCLVISSIASCSAIAGCIAYQKRRSPVEGVLLGLLLGPVGIVLEWRLAYVQRPPVDEKAWNSLHSMMTYQESRSDRHRRSSRND